METKKAGRKPLPAGEKKIAITIFPKAKDIEKVGGIEQAKDNALQSIAEGKLKLKEGQTVVITYNSNTQKEYMVMRCDEIISLKAVEIGTDKLPYDIIIKPKDKL